jgi:hypothetical protein
LKEHQGRLGRSAALAVGLNSNSLVTHEEWQFTSKTAPVFTPGWIRNIAGR